MIDLDFIQSQVNNALADAMKQVKDGPLGFGRGSRARFLLQSEVQKIAFDTVSAHYDFFPRDFPDYVSKHPDVLTATVENGPLGKGIEEAVRMHMATKAIENASAILAANTPASPTDILADIEDTLTNHVVNVRSAYREPTHRALQACYDEPSSETYYDLYAKTFELAAQMKHLMWSLDIADPPTADVAGRCWRRLQEAADQIDHLLHRHPNLQPNTPAMA